MAIPERTRNSQVLLDGFENDALGWRVAKTIAQVNMTMTEVRMAVAKFESIPVTPIFASTAVPAAKSAESNAQPTHVMLSV